MYCHKAANFNFLFQHTAKIWDQAVYQLLPGKAYSPLAFCLESSVCPWGHSAGSIHLVSRTWVLK